MNPNTSSNPNLNLTLNPADLIQVKRPVGSENSSYRSPVYSTENSGNPKNYQMRVNYTCPHTFESRVTKFSMTEGREVPYRITNGELREAAHAAARRLTNYSRYKLYFYIGKHYCYVGDQDYGILKTI